MKPDRKLRKACRVPRPGVNEGLHRTKPARPPAVGIRGWTGLRPSRPSQRMWPCASDCCAFAERTQRWQMTPWRDRGGARSGGSPAPGRRTGKRTRVRSSVAEFGGKSHRPGGPSSAVFTRRLNSSRGSITRRPQPSQVMRMSAPTRVMRQSVAPQGCGLRRRTRSPTTQEREGEDDLMTG